MITLCYGFVFVTMSCICTITLLVSRSLLEQVFNAVVTVDVLDSGDSAHLTLMKRPELGVTFTKFHCWTLTQYTKCVFLDADMLASAFIFSPGTLLA